MERLSARKPSQPTLSGRREIESAPQSVESPDYRLAMGSGHGMPFCAYAPGTGTVFDPGQSSDDRCSERMVSTRLGREFWALQRETIIQPIPVSTFSILSITSALV
jgi:hypothetical protein